MATKKIVSKREASELAQECPSGNNLSKIAQAPIERVDRQPVVF